MISKILNIYVMILAIVGILIALDVVSVTSTVKLEILRPPAYVIDLNELQAEIAKVSGEIPKDFLRAVKVDEDVRFIIVDSPEIDTSNFRKGRLATDGKKVFSSWGIILSSDVLLRQLLGQGTPDQVTASQPLLSSDDKRITLAGAFDEYLRYLTIGYKTIAFTSDSLLKIVASINPPPLYPIFSSRTVYNFISVENLSDCKAQDIVITVVEPTRYKRHLFPTLEVVLWTLPDAIGASKEIKGPQLEFKLPVLREKANVQLLVKTKSSMIEEENINIEYSKVKSLKKKLMLRLLIGLLISSIFIYKIESQGYKRLVDWISKKGKEAG